MTMVLARPLPAALLMSLWAVAPAGAAESGGERLAALRADRLPLLRELVDPMARCLPNRDNDAALFHGCGDWGTAVQATWVVVLYSGLSDDDRYVPMLRSHLTNNGLRQEWLALQRDQRAEMPYGRAWFLRLAIDYDRAAGQPRLRPIADHLAQTLREFYRAEAPDPRIGGRDNPALALTLLHDWAASRQDPVLLRFVADTARASLLATEPSCDPAKEVSTWREAVPRCLQRAALAARVLTRDDLRAWLGRFLPAEARIEPLETPLDSEQASLNFARAAALWALAAASGDERWRDLYVAHLDAGLRLWRRLKAAPPQQGYGVRPRTDELPPFSEHVAGFGALALLPLFTQE